MKIAYVLAHDITKNDGVTKKIVNQIEEWKKLGHEVKVFTFLPKKGESILNSIQYEYGGAIKFRIFKNKSFFKDINDFNPDLVYMRYTTIGINTFLLMKKFNTIVELNTYSKGEDLLLLKKNTNLKNLVRYLLTNWSTNISIYFSKGIVSVTYEILEKLKIKNKKAIVIPNSISLNNYNTVKEKGNRKKVELFFIGSPNQPWHGVDFIEKLALLLPQYNFHIIGMDGLNKKNLFWHGYLSQEKYINIIKKCHIGIGTLAYYRNGMLEGCPLKVREYLAYGFPIIIGYEDTAFKIYNEMPDWVLKINTKNLENEIPNIVNFIEKYKNVVLNKRDVEKYISSEIFEKKREEFFREIITNK